MGMIGFTVTGVAIYRALDDAGLDAAAHEVQDLCNGHPQGQGQYHYHNGSPCLPGADSNAVVGWALDGYPILGLTYASAYRLTPEYPDTMGCFSGQVMRETQAAIRQAMGPARVRASGQTPQP
jgi:YHYH protein